MYQYLKYNSLVELVVVEPVPKISKTAGYFQYFIDVDIAIKSKNKRGHKPLETNFG